MGLIQRRGTPSSSSGSLSARAPGQTPIVGAGSSLAQTRLNRIVNPSLTYFRSYVRWYLKLKDREKWSDATLTARLYELGPQTASLEREVRHPLSTMTGEEWAAAEDRLQKLWGQQRAIEENLQERRYSTPRPATPVPAGTGSASTSCSAETADPFADQ